MLTQNYRFFDKNFTERHGKFYQPNFIRLRLKDFTFDTASLIPAVSIDTLQLLLIIMIYDFNLRR